MTKKDFEKMKPGCVVFKPKGDKIVIQHKDGQEIHDASENAIGQITKIDSEFSDFVFVLWPGMTHSERIRYTDLRKPPED